MKRTQVYVWGFPENELANWPDDLLPVPVDLKTWPQDAPVLIHSNSWHIFQQHASSNRSVASAAAVLYLSGITSESEEAWAFFDDIIHDGNWDKINFIAKYPRLFEVQQWASALRADQLDDVINLPEKKWDTNDWPIPEAVKALLDDSVYRDVFIQAANWHDNIRSHFTPYSEAQLIEYIKGRTDVKTCADVERFLEGSPAGRAIIDHLKDELGYPFVDWPLQEVDFSDATENLHTFGLILPGMIASQQYTGILRTRGSKNIKESVDLKFLQKALVDLQHGKEVSFKIQHLILLLSYDPSIRVIIIDGADELHKNLQPVFWIELRYNNTSVLEKKSIGGRIALANTELLQAISKGADKFVLITGQDLRNKRK